jgi:hypothetical protein
MRPALEVRATMAFEEGGEKAYWDTLSTPPRQVGPRNSEPTDNHKQTEVPVDGTHNIQLL